MSRRAWIILGSLFALLLVALLSRTGHLSNVVAFMDAHEGFFSGVAALVTAAATLVIARYTRGTWEAFRYEREEREATRAHLLLRIRTYKNHLNVGYAFIAGLLALPREDRDAAWYKSLEYSVHEPLERLRNELPNLSASAQRISPHLAKSTSEIQTRVVELLALLPDSFEDLEEKPEHWLEERHEDVRRVIDLLDEALEPGGTDESHYPDVLADGIQRSVREDVGNGGIFSEGAFEKKPKD